MLAAAAAVVSGSILYASGWVQRDAACRMSGCDQSGWTLALTAFILPGAAVAILVWIVATKEEQLPRSASAMISGSATAGIVVATIVALRDSPDPDHSQQVAFAIMEGPVLVWPTLFAAGAFTAMAYEARQRRRGRATALAGGGSRGTVPIPPPPPWRDFRIHAYVGAAVLTCCLVSVVSLAAEHLGCSGNGCSSFLVVGLASPVLAMVFASLLVTRGRRALSNRERWVLAVSIWLGVGAAGAVFGLLEGGDPSAGLLALVLMATTALPILWCVATVVSWGFEARRALGRRGPAPARPDVGD